MVGFEWTLCVKFSVYVSFVLHGWGVCGLVMSRRGELSSGTPFRTYEVDGVCGFIPFTA